MGDLRGCLGNKSLLRPMLNRKSMAEVFGGLERLSGFFLERGQQDSRADRVETSAGGRLELATRALCTAVELHGDVLGRVCRSLWARLTGALLDLSRSYIHTCRCTHVFCVCSRRRTIVPFQSPCRCALPCLAFHFTSLPGGARLPFCRHRRCIRAPD